MHLRIAATDDEPNMRDYLEELLPRLGHQAVVVSGGRQLIEVCRASAPDLVLADVKLDDGDGLEAVAEINREREIPVILISAYHDAELRARASVPYVVGYLIKPIKQADLETAIDVAMARFGRLQELRREAAELRQSLEDRKVIERAKGVLMRRLRVDEGGAYLRLRKLSSHQNRKLIEVARAALTAEEVFADLETD